jgi:hypothetical protein
MGDDLMIQMVVTIELTSDAEPGSGLGTELVNALVPRDHETRPYLPASHLKGLLRDQLETISQRLGWPTDLSATLFGEGGVEGGDGRIGLLQLSDAVCHDVVATRTITRTKIGDLGTAEPNTLRTVEAIPAGARFRAEVSLATEPAGVHDLAARLCLGSLPAVGGGRTRGAGACVVGIEGEDRSPGQLLRLLDAAVRPGVPARPRPHSLAPRTLDPHAPASLFRLTFRARSSICCPETPLVGNNVVRSGFTIPASAVQGALLTRLDEVDHALASACFADHRFRAWPLLPSGEPGAPELPVATRVALSHRTSKLAEDGGRYVFRDAAIEPYDWRAVAGGSPLKATDGVLLRDIAGRVTLWRAADMPHLITAHAVHFDPGGGGGRNLFTVEAMGPLAWTGIVALPVEAGSVLAGSLAENPAFVIGKRRTIQGHGRMELRPVTPEALDPLALPNDMRGRVFIVQSPLAIPDDWEVRRAEATLQRLIEDAGWGAVQLETRVAASRVARTQAACAVRFGWNRHGLGIRVDGHNRLRARRVVVPGSVVVLGRRLSDVPSRLLAGVGDGRAEGFGALAPHPGIAVERYSPAAELATLKSLDTAGREGLAMWTEAGRGEGPSPSQIAAVIARVQENRERALDYLKKQREERPARIWHRWRAVIDHVEKLLQEDPLLAVRSLRVWQDLAVAHRGEEDQQR